MNIAVYSGSFNPLHIGHLAIIKHMIEEAGFDMVYLIVSPKNPLKDGISSATGRERYEAAVAAVERRFLHSGLSDSGRNDNNSIPSKEGEYVVDMPPSARGCLTAGKAGINEVSPASDGRCKVRVDDIELNMPEPHYTVRTLKALRDREPENNFTFVMGADNLADIRRWREYQTILRDFGVAVFPRTGHDLPQIKQNLLLEDPAYKIQILNAPLVNISSTQIREAIANCDNITSLLM